MSVNDEYLNILANLLSTSALKVTVIVDEEDITIDVAIALRILAENQLLLNRRLDALESAIPSVTLKEKESKHVLDEPMNEEDEQK